MDEKQFQALSGKMDTIIRLLALNAVEGKQLKDQVLMLSSFGFQPKQIAEMLGRTPNHISVIMHGLRKEKSQQMEDPKESQSAPSQGEPVA